VLSKRIKILHIIETSGPGGAETVLLNVVNHLDHSRYQSIVVLLKPGWLYQKLRESDISTIILRSAHSYDLRFLLKLWLNIKKHRIDLIHSHLPDVNLYSCLAGFMAGIPVVTTYHGRIRRSQKTNNPDNLKYFLIGRLSTKVVAVSDWLKNDLVRVAQFSPGKVKTIYNGVDWEHFDFPFNSVAKKGELKIDLDEKIVGIVANLRAAKGYEYFVRAAAIITQNIPKVRFLIIGEGDNEVMDRIIKESKALGLTDQLIFLGFREDVPELLSIMDVFVLSSISEGLSIATIEAMAAGVPVVVTKSGGPQEVVIEGVTGFLVPSEDEKSLAEKVVLLLKNKELAISMGKVAQAQVRAKFNLERMIGNYQMVYQECLEKGAHQV
jgi:glycosyltransferase involved in cell wall biosynthesis